MIVLNLFIGVIMNSMQEASVETERAEELKRRRALRSEEITIEHELFELQSMAQALADRVLHIQKHSARTHHGEPRLAPTRAEEPA